LARSRLPGFELVAWQGVVAPAGRARAIGRSLSAQIGKLVPMQQRATTHDDFAGAFAAIDAGQLCHHIKSESTAGRRS